MKKLLIFVFITLIFVVYGCSSVYNTQQITINKNSKIYVAKFKNNTETFLAGERAASITKAILRSKGYNVINMSDSVSEEDKYSLEKIKSEAKSSDAEILVTGEVNEWRYKTGIDGEPAVGLSVVFIDLGSDKILFSSVGAKSGWGHESITTIAQKLLNNLIQ